MRIAEIEVGIGVTMYQVQDEHGRALSAPGSIDDAEGALETLREREAEDE